MDPNSSNASEYNSDIEEDSSPDVKTILLYVDCYFAAISPGGYLDKTSDPYDLYSSDDSDEPDDPLEPMPLEISKLSDPFVEKWGSKTVFTVMAPCNDKGYPASRYIFDIPYAKIMLMQNKVEIVNPLPDIHRWVTWLNLYGWQEPSSDSDRNKMNLRVGESPSKVLFIDVHAYNHYNLEVKCPYARFTGYWWSNSQYDDFSATDVLSTSDAFCVIRNQFLFPIFKPWAECDLLLWCNDNTFVQELPNYFKHFIAANYKDKYRQTFTINVIPNSNVATYKYLQTSLKTLMMYATTAAPFKNEMYCTHGVREEFDIQTYNGLDDVFKQLSSMGRTSLLLYKYSIFS